MEMPMYASSAAGALPPGLPPPPLPMRPAALSDIATLPVDDDAFSLAMLMHMGMVPLPPGLPLPESLLRPDVAPDFGLLFPSPSGASVTHSAPPASPARLSQPGTPLAQCHELGTCKPCLYFNSGLCHKGSACTFCHLQHSRKRIFCVRPSKRTRQCLERRSRRIAELQVAGQEGTSGRLQI